LTTIESHHVSLAYIKITNKLARIQQNKLYISCI